MNNISVSENQPIMSDLPTLTKQHLEQLNMINIQV